MPPIKEQYFKDLGDYYDNVVEFETLRGETADLQEPVFLLQPQPHDTFESIPVKPSPQDLSYAVFAKDSYNPIEERRSFNNYDYLPEESTNRIATYTSDVNNELVFAIKGTNPDEPVADFFRNSGIALGSLGTVIGLETFVTGPQLKEYKDHIKSVRNKYLDKKVKVVGHSQGGSYANYIGVDEPDYDVITYNMGTGFPFMSNSLKCRLSDCNNISNYRVVGDWSSILGGQGNSFMLRPKLIDEELIKQAEEVEKFYLPSEVFVAHGVNQFIGRDKKKLKTDYGIYGRKIAGRLGAVGLGLISEGYDIEKFLKGQAVERGYFMPETIPTRPRTLRGDRFMKRVDWIKEQQGLGFSNFYGPMRKKIGIATSFLGVGAGQLLGEKLYDYVLKPSPEELAPF